MNSRSNKRRNGVLSRTESVLVSLRDMITRGDFPAGFHLQEIPLAESLGVSRTPIRNALNMLSQEGLLDPGPRRGYKVRSFSVEEILKAYEVRGSLEGTACRLLAERGLDDAQARRLKELLEFGDNLLAPGTVGPKDSTGWSEMNEELHKLIIHGTGNTILESFIAQIYKVPLASARHVHWYRFDTENYNLARIAHSHHHSIVDALVKRQSARAESCMREHVYFSYGLIQQNFIAEHVGFDTVLDFPVSEEEDTEEVAEIKTRARASMKR